MSGPTPRQLVERFYHDVWNQSDEAVAAEILAVDLSFRGSLGAEKRGRDGFIAYMRGVQAALGDYTCRIDDLVESPGAGQAAARMTFRGVHRAEFLGAPATGREVSWAGAAFFTIKDGRIVDIWVLGDVDGLKRSLGAAHPE